MRAKIVYVNVSGDQNVTKIDTNVTMSSMGSETGKSLQEAEKNTPFQPTGIAIALGKGDSSVQALRWTLETLVTPGSGPLHLLHVQDLLQFIQTPLGPLPIDQANEESRKQAKKQQSTATEKLLQKYTKMCEKKKVEFKVHCVENTSIQKAIVEQICKLGISKLVLGSSHSKLKRFLKGTRTSAVLAQNVPAFCAVMVVRNGRLSSVKDANNSAISSDSSSFPNNRHNSSESSPLPNRKYDSSMCGTDKDTLSEPGSYTTRTDNSVPFWTPSSCSELSFGSESEHQERGREDRDLTLEGTHVHASMSQYQLSSSTVPNHCEQLRAGQFRYRLLGTDATKELDMTLESAHVDASMSQSQLSISTVSNHCEQLRAGQLRYRLSGTEATKGVVLEDTKYQAMDPKHNQAISSRSQDTLKLPTNNLELILSSQRNIRPSEPVDRAVSFEKVPYSFLQGTSTDHGMKQSQNRDEICAALQEALRVSEENAMKALAEEVKRREDAVIALSNAKKIEADFLKQEVTRAKQQAASDRSKYFEALSKLEDLKKELAREIDLRKNAEERALKANQDVARLLRKVKREYTEFSFEELIAATNNFSEDGKLGEGGYGGVYVGTINHMAIAVKVLRQEGIDGQQQFQHEVEVLSHIHHPNIVALLGSCQEKACIVYEYMENGSLEDRLMCKGGTPPLPWYVRFSICFEVTTALIFLHNLAPKPIVHRDLKPGNILLDCNFVSKLSDAGLARWIPNNVTYNFTVYRETRPAGTFAYMDPEYLRTGSFGPHSDLFALGIVILQVLTGKPPVGVVDLVEAAVDEDRVHEILDRSAGDWPLLEAMELAKLGLQCVEPRRRDRPNLETKVFVLLKRLHEVAQNAAVLNDVRLCNGGIPSLFICPLSQEIMNNPQTAADGFTYEYTAIKNWLIQHDISPLTNLKLTHKQLTKNHVLQTKIKNWKEEKMCLEVPNCRQ